MSRVPYWRILLVLLLLAPLVLMQGVPSLVPAWMEGNLAGIPGPVVATVLWFATFILLTWWFAMHVDDSADRGPETSV